MYGLLSLTAVALLFLLAGCSNIIAPKIVAPREGSFSAELRKSPSGEFLFDDLYAYISTRYELPVGPPPAKLSVAVIPAGHYGIRFATAKLPDCITLYLNGPVQAMLMQSLTRRWRKEHHLTPAQDGEKFGGDAFHFVPAPIPQTLLTPYRAAISRVRTTDPPKGTVILLPGYGAGKMSMLPWTLILGRAGYRSILVDLRAQGRSTGAHVTYGALESRDIAQVVATLRQNGIIHGPLVLMGFSMGAATALLAAPNIPDLGAVVAIAPYASAASAIPRYAGLVKWYAKFIPASSWEAAETEAGRISGISLTKAAPLAVVSHIHAPVFYIQSEQDGVVTPDAAHALATHTPSEYLLQYRTLTHLQLMLAVARLDRPVVRWLDHHVGKNTPLPPPPGVGAQPKNSMVLTLCMHPGFTGKRVRILVQQKETGIGTNTE